MKILLLSDINSAHTQKWVIYLSKHNLNIGIFSLSQPHKNWWENYENIQLLHHSNINEHYSIIQKIKYPFYTFALKKIIQSFKPDILHAHYASSYGLIGALSKFHPFIISVWGSDVFDFPKKNFMNKKILKFNLNQADIITSTSNIMTDETQQYTSKKIITIPFGVDTKLFHPSNHKKIFTSNEIVIGTVKTLAHVYGIDLLIKAFYQLLKKNPQLNLKLLVVGDGPHKNKLINLCQKLNIQDKVIFWGKVDNEKIPQLMAEIDIFVLLSREESFGVAAVEAMSCEKPIVASSAAGLSEIIENFNTGLIVEKNNPEAAANAIHYLLKNPQIAYQISKNARQKVLELYDIEKNVNAMLSLYSSILH